MLSEQRILCSLTGNRGLAAGMEDDLVKCSGGGLSSTREGSDPDEGEGETIFLPPLGDWAKVIGPS